MIKRNFTEEQCQIVENDSGLHFSIKLTTDISDKEIIRRLEDKEIRIRSINDCDMSGGCSKNSTFLISYSNLDVERFEEAVFLLKEAAKM